LVEPVTGQSGQGRSCDGLCDLNGLRGAAPEAETLVFHFDPELVVKITDHRVVSGTVDRAEQAGTVRDYARRRVAPCSSAKASTA